MPETIRCPDCGHKSPAGSASCSHCNYPLQETLSAFGQQDAVEPEIVIRRPVRRRRPRPAADPTALSLWLFAGVLAALALIWTAYTSFRKNNAVPVEGATAEQQQLADSLRAVLGRDSTNVDATIEYANILYDTANWPEAARHYARAIARDSTRVAAIVDLGVCYYNQGNALRAEGLFQLALTREPHQPVALFNLGIVNASREEYETALKYFHRALGAGPPEPMRQQIVRHMEQILQKTGRKASPLAPGGMPQGMPPGAPQGHAPPSGGGGK